MDSPKVGIYLRLSRDDEREGESSSIENQRSYLVQYAKSRGWTVEEEYVDDGWSGLTFDRPQFQRLLLDIEANRINTVVTKDLSRLGRDQIYTAYYYQIYFPQRGVRYIAVSEGFDTLEAGESSALFPFLTAANDFYTSDVSRKVRSALTARRKEGKFIGSKAPLGYEKDSLVQGRLAVNKETAPIIRHIFRRYLELGSVTGLAKELTEEKVPTPSQCQGSGAGGGRFPGTWSGTMVRRILTNPTYIGHLTQNRRVKVNYKLKKRINLPEDQWIIVPNTHPPIVDQELYDQVQALLAVHSYQGERRGACHLLTGLAYCADCGSPMTYVRESHSRTYMVCQGYRKGGRLKLCTPHRVREDRVLETIYAELIRLTREVDWQRLEATAGEEGVEERYHRQREQMIQKLERQRNIMASLYRDRAAGQLTEEEFWELFCRARDERSRLEKGMCRLSMPEQEERHETAKERVEKMLSFTTPERGTLVALVDRILVRQDKTIEIFFRFLLPGGADRV